MRVSRSGQKRRLVLARAQTVALLLLVALALGPDALKLNTARAQIDREFTPRFTQNVNGAVVSAANTLLTCPDSDDDCADSRDGDGDDLKNNDFNMVTSTPTATPRPSIRARPTSNAAGHRDVHPLRRPLLGGRTDGGSGAATPRARAQNQVRFVTPASGGYTTVTAVRVDEFGRTTTRASPTSPPRPGRGVPGTKRSPTSRPDRRRQARRLGPDRGVRRPDATPS